MVNRQPSSEISSPSFRKWFLFAALPFVLAAIQNPAEDDKKPPEPLKVAPRAYFVDHCQRCHGVDGFNYPANFAKDEGPEKLRADIIRMADGAGTAPIKEKKDVDVQVAYHELMSAKRPFIAWTGREGLKLKGEVSDGATLVSNLGKVEVNDDSEWTLTLASEADLAKLKLTATLEKKDSTLEFAKGSYSTLPKDPEK